MSRLVPSTHRSSSLHGYQPSSSIPSYLFTVYTRLDTRFTAPWCARCFFRFDVFLDHRCGWSVTGYAPKRLSLRRAASPGLTRPVLSAAPSLAQGAPAGSIALPAHPEIKTRNYLATLLNVPVLLVLSQGWPSVIYGLFVLLDSAGL